MFIGVSFLVSVYMDKGESMQGVTFETLRNFALTLPGLEEGRSYGTPAFRVRKKLLARLWEDGQVLVLRVEDEDREFWTQTHPDTFFMTDHYRGSSYMLVRLPMVEITDLCQLLEKAWRHQAPKRLVDAYENQ